MIITKIELENYRGVKNKQSVSLSNFSSIVGKNDAGKSIILNALATFLDPKTYKIVESDFNDNKENILISCSFFDSELKGLLEDKIKTKIKKDAGLDYFINDVLFDDCVIVQKSVIKSGNSFNKINILIRDFENEDFSNLYIKSDEDLNEVLKKYKIIIPVEGQGRNSKMEKIKYLKKYCMDNNIKSKNIWIEDIYKISDILPAVELFVSDYGLEADTKFKTNSVSEIQDFFREEIKDNTKKLFNVEKDIRKEMGKEAESIKAYMKDYTTDLKEVKIDPDIKWSKAIDGVDVSFQFEGDSKPIPMSHKGSGYRRLFMVARFRYLAEKNKGSNVIYLIEEPETFLHPSAQNDLLNSFKDLSESNQIIITTHSPVFAGATDYNSVILCKKEDQSVYKTIDDEDKNSFIKSIIDELGIKPYYNMRDDFEKIFFVESDNDIKFYDLISEKILGEKISDNTKILCLPFGGNNIDSFINIKYFDNSHRDLYLIIDSDKHLDSKIQKKQIKRCEDFNNGEKKNGYVLKKACIENYYHPRAIKRVYGLNNEELDFFAEDDSVRDKIKEIAKNKKIQIKEKNNFDVFNKMRKEEWEDVVENELINFLKDIIDYEE